MSQQFLYNTQFLQGANYFQQYNIEILNYTSLNFARPDKSKDSHTAAMTAERRKLFDQLPNLNTKKLHNKKKSPLKESKIIDPIPIILSPDHDKDDNVTQPDAHVRFVLEPEKLHVDTAVHEDSKMRKHQLKQKLLRRVSAPTQGIEDYYHKHVKNNKDIGPYVPPPVHVEIDESVEDEENNHHHNNHNNNHHNNHHNNHNHNHRHHHDRDHDHDHNDNDNDNNQNACPASMSSSIASVSSIASHNPPPSLSPCSSASSIGSSVDMLSPVAIKPPNFPQAYAIAKKSKSISSETQHAHSLPDIVASNPYSNEPWSPAAMFLSNFAVPSIKQALPDDEGQQIGEYIIGKVIGRGGFSTVKESYTMDQNSGTMKTAAVKIVRNNTENESVQALLEREIAIWRELDHENIVQMLSVVENHYATFVFSEFCSGGTLLDYIKKHGKGEGKGLYEDDARNIFLEIAEGVRYLHNDVRLVHKDLKLDNILLAEDETWKICDFGFTEFQNSVNGFNDILYNSIVGGSLAYCAPEQLRSPTPLKDPSVDVWSLGVVLFAMVTGQLPFCDSFEPRLQYKIINGRFDESLLDDSGVSDDLRDLLKGMFKTKPGNRLTISEVLEHRWCER